MKPRRNPITGAIVTADVVLADGAGADERIRQEILLGIGGYRALGRLGIEPTVCHMNEGHSAFLALERIRRLMERHGLNFREAKEAATRAAIARGDALIYNGRLTVDELLGEPDLLRREGAGYAAIDIK